MNRQNALNITIDGVNLLSQEMKGSDHSNISDPVEKYIRPEHLTEYRYAASVRDAIAEQDEQLADEYASQCLIPMELG